MPTFRINFTTVQRKGCGIKDINSRERWGSSWAWEREKNHWRFLSFFRRSLFFFEFWDVHVFPVRLSKSDWGTLRELKREKESPIKNAMIGHPSSSLRPEVRKFGGGKHDKKNPGWNIVRQGGFPKQTTKKRSRFNYQSRGYEQNFGKKMLRQFLKTINVFFTSFLFPHDWGGSRQWIFHSTC